VSTFIDVVERPRRRYYRPPTPPPGVDDGAVTPPPGYGGAPPTGRPAGVATAYGARWPPLAPLREQITAANKATVEPRFP